MKELWSDIPGYDGAYRVSNHGRVMSLKKTPRILKQDIKRNGYITVCLWKNNQKRNWLVHRLVATCFLENPEGYSDINHIDENKMNNRAENLEWCSHLYNMNYGTVREKISNSNKGRKLSEEHKKKCASAKGKRWMHDGTCERLIKEALVPLYQEIGFRIGRMKNV